MHIVIDIDGTVADNKHRAHYLMKGNPKDWDSFLKPDLVLKDTPFPGVREALERFQELKYEIIFVTGRDEKLRDTTMRWLYEHMGFDANENNLYMRTVGNMMNAAAYKREQIMAIKRDRHIQGRGFLFIDDDPSALEMYAEHGVTLYAPFCWDTMFVVKKDMEDDD